MLKISEGKCSKQTAKLLLEGRLVGPWVKELREACEPVVGEGRKLALDLGEVSFADETGVLLLLNLKQRGIKLLHATPFLEEQLKAMVSAPK